MTFAMAEELKIAQGGKEDKYRLLYSQIKSVTECEDDLIANMANAAAMIHETFGFWWTGFYRVIGKELVLGPFQGPLACSRIPFGKGVCGTAWKNAETVIVPDVDAFPGHIACSSASKSEIVVPVFGSDSTERKQASIIAVLDIDSATYATFNEADRLWLERIVALL
jgi:GAF domain-containing protein